jgi:hypothetical protein
MHAPQMPCGRRWPECARQATVEHVEAAAAVATGHAAVQDDWTRASSAVATASGHAAGSEVQFVDERVVVGGAGVAARLVPPRRPCSVGWRGATVLCTRALRDAEWARLTAEYRETHASSCSPSGWRSAAAIDAMEPLFAGDEWPSLAHKKVTLQRAREHALLSEFSAEELAQQRRFVFVDLGSRAFGSSTQDFLRNYPHASRFDVHAFDMVRVRVRVRANPNPNPNPDPNPNPNPDPTPNPNPDPDPNPNLNPNLKQDAAYVAQWQRSAERSKNRRRANPNTNPNPN